MVPIQNDVANTFAASYNATECSDDLGHGVVERTKLVFGVFVEDGRVCSLTLRQSSRKFQRNVLRLFSDIVIDSSCFVSIFIAHVELHEVFIEQLSLVSSGWQFMFRFQEILETWLSELCSVSSDRNLFASRETANFHDKHAHLYQFAIEVSLVPPLSRSTSPLLEIDYVGFRRVCPTFLSIECSVSDSRVRVKAK